MNTPDEPTPDTINSVPVCRTCRSERVVKDAWACFNRHSGLWELENVFDAAFCHRCEEDTKLDWVPAEAVRNLRIRDLNDLFRREGQGNGTVLITSGMQAEGGEFVVKAVEAVRTFDAFGEDNDPWGEHDFGAVEVEGQKVFFKFDYYDPTFTAGSENPANEALTKRVLTIMLAREY